MKGPQHDPRVTAAVDYLQRHLDQPITIQILAQRAHLSPSRFRHIFVAHTGLSPAHYLQRLRLRRARLLIERTFLSVKEVMALVGYNDPSHFAREFRRVHGAPPSALRGDRSITPLPAGDRRVAERRSAVSAGSSPQAIQPMHRRIGQAKTREPSRRCA